MVDHAKRCLRKQCIDGNLNFFLYLNICVLTPGVLQPLGTKFCRLRISNLNLHHEVQDCMKITAIEHFLKLCSNFGGVDIRDPILFSTCQSFNLTYDARTMFIESVSYFGVVGVGMWQAVLK